MKTQRVKTTKEILKNSKDRKPIKLDVNAYLESAVY